MQCFHIKCRHSDIALKFNDYFFVSESLGKHNKNKNKNITKHPGERMRKWANSTEIKPIILTYFDGMVYRKQFKAISTTTDDPNKLSSVDSLARLSVCTSLWALWKII